jgi:hypothetical protein
MIKHLVKDKSKSTRLKFRNISIALVCIAHVCCKNIHAQMSVFPKAFGIRAGYGFIVPHSSSVEPLINGHISSFELNYRYNFSGVKEWEKTYRYPYSGIAFHYMNFNNDKTGSAISVMPYFAFPLKKNKILDAHFRVATGIAYITRKFDLLENRKNLMIGSNLNAAVDLLLQANWKIDRKIHFLTGISLTHFSNGAFSVPNTGINVLSVNSGLTINIGQPVAVNHNKFPILRRSLKWLAWGGFWLKEVDQVGGAKLGAGTISVNALKRYSMKGSFGGGVDLMYDRSMLKRKPELGAPIRAGLTFAYEIHIGKMSIPIQQGIYVFDMFKKDTFFYQRIGWRYHINKEFIAQFTLKSHLFVADYAELGIGYTFKQ